MIRRYTGEQLEKIDTYLKINEIHLDKGLGVSGPEGGARMYMVGGVHNYNLQLIKVRNGKKRAFDIKGDEVEINKLEKESGIVN